MRIPACWCCLINKMQGLEIKNLTIEHSGGILAVSDFSLSVPLGKAKLLAGCIGSGKSSILRAIAGLVEYEGEIAFEGINIRDIKLSKRNFVYASYDSPLFKNKTVEYNLAFGSRLRKLDSNQTQRRIEEISRSFEIEHLLYQKVKNLKSREKRLVIIARAFVRNAALYLINEPTRGLDIVDTSFIMKKIKMHFEDVKTCLLISSSDYASAVCLGYRAVLINGGIKICEEEVETYRKYPPNLFAALFTAEDNFYLLHACKRISGQGSYISVLESTYSDDVTKCDLPQSSRVIARGYFEAVINPVKDTNENKEYHEIIICFKKEDVLNTEIFSFPTIEVGSFPDYETVRKMAFTEALIIKKFFVFDAKDKTLLSVYKKV